MARLLEPRNWRPAWTTSFNFFVVVFEDDDSILKIFHAPCSEEIFESYLAWETPKPDSNKRCELNFFVL